MRLHASLISLCGRERFDEFFETLSVKMAYAIRILHRYESGHVLGAADIIDPAHGGRLRTFSWRRDGTVLKNREWSPEGSDSWDASAVNRASWPPKPCAL